MKKILIITLAVINIFGFDFGELPDSFQKEVIKLGIQTSIDNISLEKNKEKKPTQIKSNKIVKEIKSSKIIINNKKETNNIAKDTTQKKLKVWIRDETIYYTKKDLCKSYGGALIGKNCQYIVEYASEYLNILKHPVTEREGLEQIKKAKEKAKKDKEKVRIAKLDRISNAKKQNGTYAGITFGLTQKENKISKNHKYANMNVKIFVDKNKEIYKFALKEKKIDINKLKKITDKIILKYKKISDNKVIQIISLNERYELALSVAKLFGQSQRAYDMSVSTYVTDKKITTYTTVFKNINNDRITIIKEIVEKDHKVINNLEIIYLDKKIANQEDIKANKKLEIEADKKAKIKSEIDNF